MANRWDWVSSTLTAPPSNAYGYQVLVVVPAAPVNGTPSEWDDNDTGIVCLRVVTGPIDHRVYLRRDDVLLLSARMSVARVMEPQCSSSVRVLRRYLQASFDDSQLFSSPETFQADLQSCPKMGPVTPAARRLR
jgi:hypothetical protein